MEMFVAEGAAGALESRGKPLHQLKRATTAAAGGSGGPLLGLRMTPPPSMPRCIQGRRRGEGILTANIATAERATTRRLI